LGPSDRGSLSGVCESALGDRRWLQSYTEAARAVGRRSGDAVASLVARFNTEGLVAIVVRHGGGHRPHYSPEERERILIEARRTPDRE